MATTCSRCGASLAAGAQFCAACGQSPAAVPLRPAAPPPVAAGAKRMPIAALVILLGGLVALIGAFWLYQSGGMPGMSGSAEPVATMPGLPSDPGAPPPVPPDGTTPPGAAPATGALAAVESAPSPGTPPPAAIVAVALPAGAPAAAAAPPPPPPFEKTYECRKYVAFKIDPDTAIVTVDDEIIGIADEWADTPRTKKYEFKNEGVHYVKLQHRDYKTIWLRFKVSEKADDKTAEVELEMKKGNDKDVKDEKKEDDKKKDDKKKDEKKKDEKKK